MNRNDLIARLANPQGALLVAFIAVLMWAPLPYGSNRLWAELLLGLCLGAVLLGWATMAALGKITATPLVRRLIFPAICVVLALGWGVVQSIDLKAVAALTGIDVAKIANPVWAAASATLATNAGAYISVDPELTREAVFAGCLSVVAFLLAFLLTRERENAEMLLGAFVVISALYAMAAFAAEYLRLDFHSWLMPDAKARGRMAGPFVNPNHFAMFLSLGALAGLGLFVEGLRTWAVWDRGRRVIWRTGMLALKGQNFVWLAATACIVAALLATEARGAIVAFLCGALALIVALSVGRPRNKSDENGQRVAVALLVAVVGVALAVSADPLLGRKGEQGIPDATRTSLAASALKAMQAAPLTGQGFGAFERYYVRVADGTVQGTVDEAHNDIVETLADLGLPAGLAYLMAPVVLAGMCFSGCMNRRRDRVFSAVGFAAAIAVGIQAFVDFSLQIPAIAVAFAMLLGIGVSQSWRTNSDLVR